uniref:Putative secreted protein n=1 Tax=Anopheles triannulatus TaxID=58253 RepID=A0A2M4B2G8_9DIPT
MKRPWCSAAAYVHRPWQIAAAVAADAAGADVVAQANRLHRSPLVAAAAVAGDCYCSARCWVSSRVPSPNHSPCP